MGKGDVVARAAFEVGQARVYELRRLRTRARGGQTVSGDGTARFRLEVVEPGRGPVLRCTYLGAEASDSRGNRLAEAVMELTGRLAFRYRTWPLGRFRRVVDLGELRRQMEPVLEALLDGVPEEARRAVRATLEDTAFQAHYVRDIPLLHGAYGLTCPREGAAPMEVSVTSPLGGGAMPAVQIVRHESGDGCETFAVERLFEPDVLRRSFAAQLSAFASRIGRAGPDPADIEEVVLVDGTRFELEVPGGWPRSVTAERESCFVVKGETAAQTERIEIRRVD